MFWKKKLNSDEYQQLIKRIVELEAEQGKIITLMNSLRGIVNRRLSGSENQEETEDLKNGVLLPDEHGIS